MATNHDPRKAPTLQAAMEAARKHLDIPTLETRGRDGLDFHDISVASLRTIIAAAYDAGWAAAEAYAAADPDRTVWIPANNTEVDEAGMPLSPLRQIIRNTGVYFIPAFNDRNEALEWADGRTGRSGSIAMVACSFRQAEATAKRHKAELVFEG